MRVEQIVLVTDDGCEVLSRHDLALSALSDEMLLRSVSRSEKMTDLGSDERSGMRRRIWVVAVAACVAAAVLTGASVAAQAARSAPAEDVNLTMWWWGEQEAAGAKKWLAETIKLYEKKQYPNVTIKTVLQTTDGLIPAFKAAAAAKKGPDLQYFWGGIWSLDDAWADNTKPISDYIPRSEYRHYLNAKEDTFGGKVWTAPWYAAFVPGALPQGRGCGRPAWRHRRRGRSCSRPVMLSTRRASRLSQVASRTAGSRLAVLDHRCAGRLVDQ